ncbi:MAG TPA: exosome complex protein Rrp42 [Candidatus Thermoplasmatota archaeon]|nr:exosome complex protein Rrp42 [Candidatus Thermoplasmatota archaeon]
MEDNPLSLIKKDFLRALLKDGKREDGRGLLEQRPLDLHIGYVNRAQGSCRIKLGNTQVVAGVKIQLEKPYPDTPNRGNFMTSAELNPIASPHFEPGPPRIEAIELARVTDRALRESGVVDFEALAWKPGENVWGVFVDLHILDYDGNLFDACSIAGVAALLSAKLPATCPKTKEVVYADGKDRPLPVHTENSAFSTTFAKIGGTIVADPHLYEELIAETRLTIGLDTAGNVRAMQKGGHGSWTVDEVKQMRREAEKLHKATFTKIQKAIAAKDGRYQDK